jgi:hypothetical protein
LFRHRGKHATDHGILVLASLPTVAFACLSSEDPAFESMINNSTLIAREVIRGTGSNE